MLNRKLLLSAPLLLAACAPQGLPQPLAADTPLLTGPWTTLPASCQVRGRTEDFTLATDGHVEHNALRLYLTFKPAQIAAPTVSIAGVNIPLNVEGKSPIYGFNLPFTPAIASRLAQPATHFTVRYYTRGAPQAFESSLPTATFIDALNALGAGCP